MAKHNDTGKMGERMAVSFLEKNGFNIVCNNYLRKWGEIDIVATKDNVLHFVEVKTVSRKSFNGVFDQNINSYRPEDNMHPWKIERLKRVIETYLLEKYPPSHKATTGQSNKDIEWQFDLACVFLDQENKVAKVRFMSNLVL